MGITHLGKLFNKAGYRLLAQVTDKTAPKMPRGATSLKKSIIEHISGEKKYIYTYLDDNGKAVKIQSFSSNSPLVRETNFEFFTPQVRTPRTAIYREKVDPNAFTNFGLKKDIRIWDINTKQITEVKDKVIDINPQNKSVTINSSSRAQTKQDDKTLYTDISEITEKVNGKKTKSLYQKAISEPDQNVEIVEKSGFGVTPQDIENFTTNPYFYSLFKNPNRMISALKSKVFTDQGIPLSTKIQISPADKYAKAFYSPRTKTIGLNLGARQCKSAIVNDLNHEARHGWQHQLVDKLERNELTNPQEIAQAKVFKENFINYKPIEKCANHEEYMAQPVEADAYRIGGNAGDEYENLIDSLQKIFSNSTRKTLGE